MTLVRFGRYEFELSNRDKVLFPDAGITKGDLIDYYSECAELVVRHAAERPLTLHRFPDGIEASGFYQQDRSDYFPEWIESVPVPRSGRGGEVDHVLCNNQATLVYLANQAAITLHGWLSRTPRLACPDRLIFDLDPPDDDFAAVVRAARQVREVMEAVDLMPFVMTTGSRGLHVLAPLDGKEDFDTVRAFAKDLADYLAAQYPDSLTTAQRKDKRAGRLYLDVMRNAQGQTAVLPYVVRAKPGAPVATPLDWGELGGKKMHSQRYTLRNIRRRLAQKEDPWSELERHGRNVAAAQRALDGLRRE